MMALALSQWFAFVTTVLYFSLPMIVSKQELINFHVINQIQSTKFVRKLHNQSNNIKCEYNHGVIIENKFQANIVFSQH